MLFFLIRKTYRVLENDTPPCHDLVMIIRRSWQNIVMIMPWWRHCTHVSWHGRHKSQHDHGIIVMLPMFFKENKLIFLSTFSQVVAAIYHIWQTCLTVEEKTEWKMWATTRRLIDIWMHYIYCNWVFLNEKVLFWMMSSIIQPFLEKQTDNFFVEKPD